mmetsp:Transcript_18585/g.74183  ORF Transcript_18585/g.74183 Transcript_18585/m.74183 type:complete len:619 (-) Transcript_18585:67-1923(-)
MRGRRARVRPDGRADDDGRAHALARQSRRADGRCHDVLRLGARRHGRRGGRGGGPRAVLGPRARRRRGRRAFGCGVRRVDARERRVGRVVGRRRRRRGVGDHPEPRRQRRRDAGDARRVSENVRAVAQGRRDGACCCCGSRDDDHNRCGFCRRARGEDDDAPRPLRRVRRAVHSRDARRGARPAGGRVRRGDRGSGLPRGTRRVPTAVHRRADAAVPREAALRERRRRADLAQARGARAHGGAQDQQRRRPGAPREKIGQDAHHRRDGRRPARRRDRHRMCSPRARMYRLHGRRRLRAPIAQRVPHERPRRESRPRAVGRGDSQGRDQRGSSGLGHQRPRHALPHRLGHRLAPLPDDRPRLPVGHRQGGAPAVPRRQRAKAAAEGRRVRRRRLERHRHVPPVRRRRDRRAPRRRGRRRLGPGLGHVVARLAGGPPRHADVLAAGRGDGASRSDAFHLGRLGLSRRRPRARLPQGLGPRDLRARHQRRGPRRLLGPRAHRGHHPRARAVARRRARHEARQDHAARRGRPRQPLRPRRQGHDHRRQGAPGRPRGLHADRRQVGELHLAHRLDEEGLVVERRRTERVLSIFACTVDRRTVAVAPGRVSRAGTHPRRGASSS